MTRAGERGAVQLIAGVILTGVFAFILLAAVLTAVIGGNASSASRDGSARQKDASALNGNPGAAADPDLGGQINEVTPGECRLVCAFIPGISFPKTNALDWRVVRRWRAAKTELDSRGIRITANYAFRTTCQQSHMHGTYGVAAPVGSSMHEAGAALDINGIGQKTAGAKYGTPTALGSQVIPILRKYGFVWLPFDPMHVEIPAQMLGEPDKYSLIRKEQDDYKKGDPAGGCRGDNCAVQ